jgi:hypothetical protein
VRSWIRIYEGLGTSVRPQQFQDVSFLCKPLGPEAILQCNGSLPRPTPAPSDRMFTLLGSEHRTPDVECK